VVEQAFSELEHYYQNACLRWILDGGGMLAALLGDQERSC